MLKPSENISVKICDSINWRMCYQMLRNVSNFSKNKSNILLKTKQMFLENYLRRDPGKESRV